MSIKELRKQTGLKFKSRREQLGMNLQELAKKSGLTVAGIHKLESGVGNPTLRTLHKLSKATNTTFVISTSGSKEPAVTTFDQ